VWLRTSARPLLVSSLALLGLTGAARADAPASSFDGKWREGPLREDYTVQQWSPTGCGPAPVSSAAGGGDLVSVHQEGDELSIAGGGRVFRTNQCYDQLPTLARETHSRDPSGHSWRTRCSTPPSDPRHATMNTLVVATDSHIDVTETGRYEIVLSDGRCMADVRRSRTFDLVTHDVGAPAASATAAPAQTAAPPPPPAPRANCTSPGDPVRLEVRPSRKLLRTGESATLHAVVLDANGCATGTSTTWAMAPESAATAVTVDSSGKVSVPDGAPEGSAQVIVTAGGKSARVVIDVTSPIHYDDLLAKSGLNAAGENDAAAIAELATGSMGTADVHAEDTAKHRRSLFLAIIGALAFTLGVVGLVFRRRQQRATALEKEAELAYEERMKQADETRAAKRAAHDAAVKAHEDSLRRAQDAAKETARRDADARAQTAQAAQANAAAVAMLCPTCRREYGATSVFCPQDATKLVPLNAGDPAGGPSGSICPACKRGYPPGVRVCTQDGEELVPYAMHAAVARAAAGPPPPGLARGKICPTCGGRFDGNAAFCGKDGTALVLLN
jgi:hypothetical protein